MEGINPNSISNTNNHSNNNNTNINTDSNNMNDMNRQSESPARTIDSHDSTVDSMDTIVDRSINREEMLQAAIEQSMNTTNAQHDSLTNSQKSILSPNSSGCSDAEDHHRQQQEQQQQHAHLNYQHQNINQQTQQQMQQLHADAQSHIYSSPVYDHKPAPLKLTAATLVASVTANHNSGSGDDTKKPPKLMTHEEFQQQMQAAMASRANTLDSRISKKQRFPPELIKINDGDGGSSSNSAKAAKYQRRAKSSADCCSAFPWQIVLGTLQLMLAITLVALGSLLIVREAALSTAGCGIWTGLVAAITGSLGVVSIRKTQTSFLALSLICIATSTLALAISGIGLSRDVNRVEEKFDLLNANSEISAASGLILALFLHFVVSIVSVYRCALQICSR